MEPVMKGQLVKLVNGDTWLAEEYSKRPVPIIDRYYNMVDIARVFMVVLVKAARSGYPLTVQDVESVIATFDRVDALAEELGVYFPNIQMLKERFETHLSHARIAAVAQQRSTPLVQVGNMPKEEVVSI